MNHRQRVERLEQANVDDDERRGKIPAMRQHLFGHHEITERLRESALTGDDDPVADAAVRMMAACAENGKPCELCGKPIAEER